jgi:GAF domain-containing protein
MHPTSPLVDYERTLERIGEQLLNTWRGPDPNLTFDATLRDVLQTLGELFPDVLYSATIYIRGETELHRANSETWLYRGKTVGPLENVIQTNTSHPEGAAALILRSRQDLFVADVAHWPQSIPPLPAHLHNAQKIASFAGLPLVISAPRGERPPMGADQDEVVGVVLVVFAERQAFDGRQCQLLRLFARQAAMVVQNARVLRRRRREEEAFHQIAASASGGDPDEVATRIARQVRQLTKTAYVAVLLTNLQENRLEARGTAVYGAEMRTGMIMLDLDATSMNSHSYWTRTAYYAPDVSTDPFYYRYPGWDENMRSAYCAPLVVQSTVIGTIYVTSPQLDGIAEEDRRFLEHLAPHAAIALHHASQVAEERQRRALSDDRVGLLSKIKHFVEGITDTVTVEEQMRQIRLMFATHGIITDGFFIATYDEQNGAIAFPYVIDRGREVKEEAKTPGTLYATRLVGERRGLVDYVLHSGQTLLVDDMDAWEDREALDPIFRQHLKSCLVTPLWRAGKIIGVIGLRGYSSTRAFTTQDQELLEGVAEEIAIVIENAYRYEAVLAQLQVINNDLKERLAALSAVSEFQRRIGSIDLPAHEEIQGTDIVDVTSSAAAVDIEAREVEHIYDEAVIALRAIGVNTDNIYIALYDEESHRVTFPLVYEQGRQVNDATNPAYKPRRLGDDTHVSEWVIEQRTSLLFDNREQMADWAAKQIQKYRLPGKSHSWLGVPLIFKQRLLGVMVLRDFERENSFTPGHRDLLEIIASQAAIAIENVRLYERSRRLLIQLRALLDAGRSVAGAGFNLQSVLHTILEHAIRVTGAHFGSIYRLENGVLKLLDVWPESMRNLTERLADEMPVDGPGICALAVRANRYQLAPDVSAHPHYMDVSGETGSELAVVLQRSGENGDGAPSGPDARTPIGVLNIEHKQVGGLTRDHAGLLITFSNLASVAMQKAEQYAELEEVRERAYTSYAVAHMGLHGADWQHTIHQHAFSLATYIDGLLDLFHVYDKSPAVRPQIAEALQQMKETIDVILEARWAGFVEEPPEEVATATKIDDALHMYVEELCMTHSDIATVYDLHCPQVYVRISFHSLKMALEKLVNNALIAMPQGGRLSIRTERANSAVRIFISDTGRGIPAFARPDFLRRPIRRPPHSAKIGTGAGALIARFIALNHGGDLELIETEENRGTTLLLTLRTLDLR